MAGRAVSADPVLRVSAHGGGAAAGWVRGEPQAGEAFDAGDGSGGDLPETEHQRGAPGAQEIPVFAAKSGDRPANQVWCADITYIPMAKGFVYLVAVMDWFGRRVLSWRVSIGMDTEFCVQALKEALSKHGTPEIFNTDQGVQFTSGDFLAELQTQGVKISMDGKGRYLDNIFIERLWRSLKYEEVFLKAYGSVAEARRGIGAWLAFYNGERPHQTFNYSTPFEVYTGASACGYVDNARKGVDHIPTGTTTARKGLHEC